MFKPWYSCCIVPYCSFRHGVRCANGWPDLGLPAVRLFHQWRAESDEAWRQHYPSTGSTEVTTLIGSPISTVRAVMSATCSARSAVGWRSGQRQREPTSMKGYWIPPAAQNWWNWCMASWPSSHSEPPRAALGRLHEFNWWRNPFCLCAGPFGIPIIEPCSFLNGTGAKL
jgi:hypothetical protein